MLAREVQGSANAVRLHIELKERRVLHLAARTAVVNHERACYGSSDFRSEVFVDHANDLALQLRKRRIDQIVLAGMAANLCVESHLRHLMEDGFEVAVVRDAVAGPKFPEGDGYMAALINFRFIANGLWTTDEAVRRLTKAA